MASGSTADPFGDQETIITDVSALTAAHIKAIVKDISANSQLRDRPRISGTKAELINRIADILRSYKVGGEATKFAILREIIARNYAAYFGRRPAWSKVAPPNLNVVNANGHSHNYSGGGGYASSSSGIPPNKLASSSSSAYQGRSSSLNSTYNSRTLPPSGPGSSSSARPNFKPSPFFTIKEWMAGPAWLPEVAKPQRASTSAFFAVKPAQKALLLDSSPKRHEIRLFGCTKPSYDAALNPNHPGHVEFPMTSEAKVNGVSLTANLRGSKKAAGRVPPPNLNKDKALWLDGRPNRVDMVCTDTTVKFALLVALCEVVHSDALVKQLREKKFTTKAQVVAGMRRAAEDDEIEAGDATLSLKCPLSYMRMQTPCRSTACSHIQCFDAGSFFSVNEQTPSWSCPVCAKALKPDELFWDGYVQDILDRVPDSEDAVLVDPMGKWRTPNGKFTSEGQAAAATATTNGARGVDRFSDTESDGEGGSSPVDKKPRISNGDGEAAAGASGGGSSKPAPIAVELLDSPSPPSTSAPGPSRPQAAVPSAGAASSPLPGALSSGAATPRSASGRTPARPRQTAVIDLTLSDDDDDDDQPVSAPPAPAPPPRPFISSARSASSSFLSSNAQSNGSSPAWPPGMAAPSAVSRTSSGGNDPPATANSGSASTSFTTAQTRRRPLSSSGEDEEDESTDRIQGPGKRFRPASELFSARRLADDEFESDDGGVNGASRGVGSNGRGSNGASGSGSGSRGGGTFSAAFMRSATSGEGNANGTGHSGPHDAPFRNGAGASRAFRWGGSNQSPAAADRSASWSSAGGASGLNDSPTTVAPSSANVAGGTAGNGGGGGGVQGETQSGSALGGFQSSSVLFRDEDEDFEEAMARDEELRRAREVSQDLDGWGIMEQATALDGSGTVRESAGRRAAREYFGDSSSMCAYGREDDDF